MENNGCFDAENTKVNETTECAAVDIAQPASSLSEAGIEDAADCFDFANNSEDALEDSKTTSSRSFRGLGCFLTAITVLLLSLLVVFLFIKLVNNIADQNDAYNSAPESPGSMPNTTDGLPDGYEAMPASTPNPTQRKMPALDGKLPDVMDSLNPFPDIIEHAARGVVGVYNYAGLRSASGDERELLQGSGTGFIISSEGYIVTNAHVISDSVRLTVVLDTDEEIEAEIVGIDTTTDIAVIKINNSRLNLPALSLGKSGEIRVGEFVIAIGDPSGRELAGTATFGIVSATARIVNIEGRTNEYIQTDAAMNPGNSGGPLIDSRGAVIGIISAKTVTASYDEAGNPISAEGLGFAFPIDKAMEIVKELIINGYIERPGIGVSVAVATEDALEGTGLESGILIHAITAGGPCDEAGLAVGDIIVEHDGVAATDTDAFVALVKSKKIGDKISIRYYRNGSMHETVVIVGDLNKMG